MITKDTCRTLESLLEALPSSKDRRRANVWHQSALSAAAAIRRECPYLAVQISIEDKRPVCRINVLSLKPMNEGLARGAKTVAETVGYLQIGLACRFQAADRGLDDGEDPEDQCNQAEELLGFTTGIINTYA